MHGSHSMCMARQFSWTQEINKRMFIKEERLLFASNAVWNKIFLRKMATLFFSFIASEDTATAENSKVS